MAGERRLWERLRLRLVDKFFIQRIENLVGAGVPDVHLMSRQDGRETWLELKCAKVVPKRSTSRVFGPDGLRPEQVAWIYGRACVGARIYIVADVGGRVFLVHGRWARMFNEFTVTDFEEHSTAEGVDDICLCVYAEKTHFL